MRGLQNLFGSCVVVKATGTHRPAPERLLKAVELPNCVTREFCAGCGSLYEIHESLAQELSKKCHKSVTAPFGSGFFIVAGCIGCDGDENSVEFVSLDSLKS